MDAGVTSTYQILTNSEYPPFGNGSETVTANCHRRKGNNPHHLLRSPNIVKWERRCRCLDNQEVGLEAAILQRKRNSSLVDAFMRRKLNGAKRYTEAVNFWSSLVLSPYIYKRAQERGPGVVEERSVQHRSSTARYCGAYRSENVGMSNY